MVNELLLVDDRDGQVIARTDGLFVANAQEARDIRAADASILREQGLAIDVANGLLVSWEDWGLAVEMGARSLTAYTRPSHLLLEVDRLGEIGRPNFRYLVRWFEGRNEVAVERVGAYLRHTVSKRLMHLDQRSLAMVEAMERFNALPESERTNQHTAWGTLQRISQAATAGVTEIDRYLKDHRVIVPSTIGLTIRHDDDGAVTFLPRIPDYEESDALAARFQRDLTIADVSVFTDQAGRRVHVLWSEPQKEVLRRMLQIRKIKGAQAEQVSQNPLPIFDGLADTIDLQNIRREYGPRVIGIGPLPSQSDSKAPTGPTIFDRLGVRGEEGAKGQRSSEQATPAAGTPAPRQTVALDVLDATSRNHITLRFTEQDKIREMLADVRSAMAAGETTLRVGHHTIVVEPELEQVLRRFVASDEEGTSIAENEVGLVGVSGHLYLLINEHEDSLTEALSVPASTVPLLELRPDPPMSLRADISLQPHQLEGLGWLTSVRAIETRRGGLLADDMGLGKTLQLLAHIANLIEKGELADSQNGGANGPWRPVLIVAPLMLVETGTWVSEMQDRFLENGRIFEPFLVLRDEGLRQVMRTGRPLDLLGKPLLDPDKLMSYKVVITTYETLMAYQHSLAQRVSGRPLWSLVIFDEAQEVKSPKAKQSFAAKALDATFKIAATGTPVETRLRDLWNLLDTVEPTLLGTQRDFVKQFERPVMNTDDRAARETALGRLRKALRYQEPGAILIRRDKTILRNLPPREEHRIECAMTPAEHATISGILRGLESSRGKGTPLAALQQLHLASQHPILAGWPGDVNNVNRLLADSSRLRMLVETLRKIQSKNEKALIFARSVDAQRLLATVLKSVFGRPVNIVNGQTGHEPADRGRHAAVVRKAVLQRFRESQGFDCVILSPFVAGVGLTLVEANHVIHYGRWWNPAIENQATDRAYRIGQTRPVHVYYPIAIDPSGEISQTYDQAIDALLSERKALAQDFLMPSSEAADAARLVDRMVAGETGAPHPTRGAPQEDQTACTSLEHVAALLKAQAKKRNECFHWLGRDGVLGIHCAIVKEKMKIECVRIVESWSDEEEVIQASIVSLMSRAIPGVEVHYRLLVNEIPASEPLVGNAESWKSFEEGVWRQGVDLSVRWLPLSHVSSLTDVRNDLA